MIDCLLVCRVLGIQWGTTTKKERVLTSLILPGRNTVNNDNLIIIMVNTMKECSPNWRVREASLGLSRHESGQELGVRNSRQIPKHEGNLRGKSVACVRKRESVQTECKWKSRGRFDGKGRGALKGRASQEL